MAAAEEGGEARTRRLAVSAALFSLATGFSRVAGLLREVVVAALLGARGIAPNAFVYANNLPNTVRSLVADAALGAAFVPVFNDLLARGERERAWRVASTVLTVAAVGLGAITAVLVVFAGPVLAWTTPMEGEQLELATRLARLLAPVVLLLGLMGIVNAMLNSLDEFFVPAVAPVFWNLTIIGFLLAGFLVDGAEERVELYALGTLVGTLVQFLLPLPWLRGRGGRLRPSFAARDPAVRRVFVLMLPVTVALGLINVNLYVSAILAGLVDPTYGPRALDAAFRVYMLPQGMFSVAIAAVLFPTMSRLAARGDLPAFREQVASGVRQVLFLLLPATTLLFAIAGPLVVVLYEHGEFTPDQSPGVERALVAFAVGMSANGVVLVLTRAFFSLQRVWVPTLAAAANLAIAVVLGYVLQDAVGIWGVALATSVANVAAALLLWRLLGGQVGRLPTRAALDALARIGTAAAGLLLAVLAVRLLVVDRLGGGWVVQAAGILVEVAVGSATYLALARALRVPETALVGHVLRRVRRR